MASQGPLPAGSGANDATVGTLAWFLPTRIISSNNSYAVVSAATGTTNYLVSSSHGFTIPTGATINGIVVEIERKRSGPVNDSAVRIVKGGAISATNRSAGASWSAADTLDSFGSSSDLWGETWTSSDINASNFGVALSATSLSLSDASVDLVQITVYYTPLVQGAGPSPITRIANQLLGR